MRGVGKIPTLPLNIPEITADLQQPSFSFDKSINRYHNEGRIRSLFMTVMLVFNQTKRVFGIDDVILSTLFFFFSYNMPSMATRM